ncbi:MAG: DUF4168 domain-containing protein [Thermodesulfobacteriota bacterium]
MKQFQLNRRGIFLITICLLLAAAVSVATAQDKKEPEPVSSADLENVAIAYSQIQTIHNQLQQSIQGVEDPAEQKKLQDRANQEMIMALKALDLDVETYTGIMAQIRIDEDLRAAFMKKINGME